MGTACNAGMRELKGGRQPASQRNSSVGEGINKYEDDTEGLAVMRGKAKVKAMSGGWWMARCGKRGHGQGWSV